MHENGKVLTGQASVVGRYSGWAINRFEENGNGSLSYSATKIGRGASNIPSISLREIGCGRLEGVCPAPPIYAPKTVITGSCIYTAAWSVQICAGKNGARWFSMSLPGDLKKILHYIHRSKTIQRIKIPTKPSEYHKRLFTWQSEIIQRFNGIEKIHYTMPIEAYRGYITRLEIALERKLPILHSRLTDYTSALKKSLEESLGKYSRLLSYDNPIPASFEEVDVLESNMAIYRAVKNMSNVIAIEDIPEVGMSQRIAQQTGCVIPCYVCVLGFPDPFRLTNDSACEIVDYGNSMSGPELVRECVV